MHHSLMGKKMKKTIRLSTKNRPEWDGEMGVIHVLPNKFVQAIGPFVLLDHTFSYKQSSNALHEGVVGKCSHPHRGIATLSYILSGEVEHLDSMGNHVKLSSGGVHWMKAGKGIVHDEAISPEYRITNPDVSVVRSF
jgi:redox-sensitive bicupin YhaK (pirin superfamily)